MLPPAVGEKTRTRAKKGRGAGRGPRTKPRWFLPLIVTAAALVAATAVFLLRPRERLEALADFGPPPTSFSGEDKGFAFKIQDTHCGYENVISEETVTAVGQFCGVSVQMRNVSGERRHLDLSCQYLATADQERFPAHSDATRVGLEADSPLSMGIDPGKRAAFELFFDIPNEATPVAAVLHGDCDSPGARLALKVAESP